MYFDPAVMKRCMPQAPLNACEKWAPAYDAAAREFGIGGHAFVAWIACSSNETGQAHKFDEASYFWTPSDRITYVFGANSPSVAELDAWKTMGQAKFDRCFFDRVYGGIMGNRGEGYKYRGMGPGAITGRDNYAVIGPIIGVDLLANPELVRDDPLIGCRSWAAFFTHFKVDKVAAPGTEDSFLRAAISMNSGLNRDEFRTHHLMRWYEVRAGLGIDASGVIGEQPAPPGAARTLRQGMQGADVKALQVALLAAGYALPKYGADGGFGGETDAAVRKLQADKGLVTDGWVGAATRAALGIAA